MQVNFELIYGHQTNKKQKHAIECVFRHVEILHSVTHFSCIWGLLNFWPPKNVILSICGKFAFYHFFHAKLS